VQIFTTSCSLNVDFKDKPSERLRRCRWSGIGAIMAVIGSIWRLYFGRWCNTLRPKDFIRTGSSAGHDWRFRTLLPTKIAIDPIFNHSHVVGFWPDCNVIVLNTFFVVFWSWFYTLQLVQFGLHETQGFFQALDSLLALAGFTPIFIGSRWMRQKRHHGIIMLFHYSSNWKIVQTFLVIF